MAAASKDVVHVDEIEPLLEGPAEVRTTFRARDGLGQLEQRIVRYPAGRTEVGGREGTQEVMYVVSGLGRLDLGGQLHRLAPGTGVFIPAGDSYRVEADESVEIVSVLTVGTSAVAQKPTVRFEDQPELEASEERRYRYLINEEVGCADVTQFVGIVEPSKAPFHSHPYDEVGYIIEGEGIAHIDGQETSLKAGSCFHLAPGQVHCIENSGRGPMRILGVFHPSGSPANRAY